MKIIITRFILLSGLALLLFPALGRGQSISINSVSAAKFCGGDPVSVTFTATGTWGHKNAFTIQLSEANGDFTLFQNIGSITDIVPGTFTIVSSIPGAIATSAHYRIRILGADP